MHEQVDFLLPAHQGGLGNFQFEAALGDPILGQAAAYGVEQGLLVELARRQVDRHLYRPAELLRPLFYLAASLFQYLGAKQDDQAGTLGDRHAVGGRYRPKLRIGPAQQASKPTRRCSRTVTLGNRAGAAKFDQVI